MKGIIVFFALIVGGMIFFQQALQNGSVLKYIDENRQAKYIPEATYTIGQGYYLFQNLPEAATYFLRVAQRVPDRSLGDDAYFAYLQCLDDSVSVRRSELIEGYQAYLDKYPNGKHAEVAKARLDNYITSSH